MTPHLAALCLLFAAATAPAQPAAFCNKIRALTADPISASTHWGIAVTTLDGTPLCAVNATQLFRPASNVKLFTTIPALALLGPDRTFTTIVEVASPLAPGQRILPGNLTLRGFGDAYLSRRPMPYLAPNLRAKSDPEPANPLEAMADQIAATGLRHILGNIVGDDTAWPYEPYPSAWPLDDTPWGYGAPISALPVEDNKLALTVIPGATPGSPATVTLDPAIPFYTLQNTATTVAAHAQAAIGIDRQYGSRLLRIFGTVAIGAPYEQDMSIADPAEYAALFFKQALETRGITIDGIATARHLLPTRTDSLDHQRAEPLTRVGSALTSQGRAITAQGRPIGSTLLVRPNEPPAPCKACQTLATHISPTLLEDVKLTLKISQNQHAEFLLHQLAQAFGDDASTAQGCRVVRQFLLSAGLAKDEFFLNDGSGMSTQDLASPHVLTQLLVFAARQPWFDGFKASLPIAGVDGSLVGRFTAASSTLNGRVFAKTGTLGQTRSLSGYLTAASGRTIVFSVLADTHAPGTTADRIIMDRIVETIAAAN
jgi:D-alanyl-D-alanine carboxypeptidase/D-alanyl-D-alanine-endopeptidase (penicillin-binding protein 4)